MRRDVVVFIKSHGLFILDWGVALVFLAIAAGFEYLTPVERDVYYSPSIAYPQRANTVPNILLPFISIVFPSICIFLFYLLHRFLQSGPRSSKDLIKCSYSMNAALLHICILGLFLSVSFTYLSTNIIKVTAGRPRPDFLSRCLPANQSLFPMVCSVPKDSRILRDGRKSFPSGHSSLSFSGLVYLALFIMDYFIIQQPYGKSLRLLAVTIPILCATLVGISRVTDNRHHWSDVVAGAFLGSFFAYCSYTLYFLSPLRRAYIKQPYPDEISAVNPPNPHDHVVDAEDRSLSSHRSPNPSSVASLSHQKKSPFIGNFV